MNDKQKVIAEIKEKYYNLEEAVYNMDMLIDSLIKDNKLLRKALSEEKNNES